MEIVLRDLKRTVLSPHEATVRNDKGDHRATVGPRPSSQATGLITDKTRDQKAVPIDPWVL